MDWDSIFLQYHHIDKAADCSLPGWRSLLEERTLMPLTSNVPSTTSAALTSFWTGRQPCEHGIIGYELFLKEFGLIANMITHSAAAFIGENGNLVRAGFNPESFVPVETLGSHLRKSGVEPFALQHQSIANSGLSRMLLKEVQTIPFNSLEDLWSSAERIQITHSRQKTYTYIYWGELDSLSHRSGPRAISLLQQWQTFSNSLANFIHKLRTGQKSDTLLVLTADHGQIPTDIQPEYDLRFHPEFTRHLIMMPSGESRLPYLFIKPGHENAIRDYLDTHWDAQFSILPSETILSAGLLGGNQPYQGTIDRLGQYVAFPKNNAYWWWVNKDNHLLGRHGGLSREEMLVPFFTLEI